MGWVMERPGKGGSVRYTAMYRNLQGLKRSAGTYGSVRAAERAWQDAEAMLTRGRVGELARARQRLRQYVEQQWFPNHVIEETTREGYAYNLERYVLPHFGGMRLIDIMPAHVREWVKALGEAGARPPTVKQAKVVLDAILTTAFNDRITVIHAGQGVKTPAVKRKAKRVITSDQFDRIYTALPNADMQLLVETDIESGLRWGELTELRVGDLDLVAGVISVSRTVVHLRSAGKAGGPRFIVKQYPKDKEERQVKIAPHLVAKLAHRIKAGSLQRDDLLFTIPLQNEASRRTRPSVLPDPITLGMTEPNANGRTYNHGTLTAYQAGRCRYHHCKNAVADYRAKRRDQGRDEPRQPRKVAGDGHISGDWFRVSVWNKAVTAAELEFHVTPNGLRHAHASWLLAGGADLQVVKERLGHGSITTTENYLHSLPSAQDGALLALRSVRGDRDAPARGATSPRDEELAQLREAVRNLNSMVSALGDSG